MQGVPGCVSTYTYPCTRWPPGNGQCPCVEPAAQTDSIVFSVAGSYAGQLSASAESRQRGHPKRVTLQQHRSLDACLCRGFRGTRCCGRATSRPRPAACRPRRAGARTGRAPGPPAECPAIMQRMPQHLIWTKVAWREVKHSCICVTLDVRNVLTAELSSR